MRHVTVRMMTRRAMIIAAALSVAWGNARSEAADVTSTWANAVLGSWNVDVNWTNVPASGGFPNNGNGGVATYRAVISATGSPYTISSGVNVSLESALLGSGNATLSQTAGTFATSGLFSWTAGTLSGAGVYNANGGIDLSGTSGVTLSGTTLNHAAGQNATESSTGALTLSNGAIFNNAGNYLATTNAGIVSGPGTSTFNNSGSFTRDTSAGAFLVGTPFNNTGTVTVGLGTLSLNGTVPQYNAGTLTAGTWNVMANSTLNGSGLANITTNKATVNLSGANSTFTFFNVLSSNLGTLTLAGGRNFTATTTFANSGTITTAPGSTFASPFLFTWTAGTLNGGGMFNANGGTTMSGSVGKTLDGSTFNNNSVLTMSGSGALTLNNGATFKNPSSFAAQSDAGIASGTGANVFNNTGAAGTFTRNTSTGTFVVAVPFNNAARVNVNSGTLLLNGSVTQYSLGTQTLSGGIWSISANSTLGGAGFGPITINGGNVTLNGLNSVFAPINSITTNTGVLVIMAGRNFATVGAVSNSGTLSAGVGSTINLSGPFTWTAGIVNGGGTFNANAGISLSGIAITTLDGSTLNNPAGHTTTVSGSGAFLMQNGATFANAGSFLAQSDAGITSGSGNNVFNNTGTFARNSSSGTYVVACNFSNSGEVDVTSGTLQFNGTVSQSVSGQMFVQGGAAVFNSSFVNAGSVTVTGATALTFNGPVTNNGTILVCGGATLGGATASFTNNGTLDVITANFTVPPGFVNNGIVLDSSVVKIKQATLLGPSFTALIDSYTGHIYQFQRSSSLSGGTFSNLGAPQAGSTGTTLSFNDPAASPTEGFYRVLINP